MVYLIFLLCLFGVLHEAKSANHFKLKHGIPDGSILTFFIKHKGSDSYPESVTINFYNSQSNGRGSDISAQVHVDRDEGNNSPVRTQCFLHGRWYDRKREVQALDEISPSNGWWRVDLLKLNKFRFNVFFQGFWSGVRRFRSSLDDIQSIYVFSETGNIDDDNVTMPIKIPNSNIPMVTHALFYEIGERASDNLPPRVFATFSKFPVGAHMELSTFLRSSGNAQGLSPTLGLRQQNLESTDQSMALAIVQKWETDTQKIRLVRIDSAGKWEQQVECSFEKPTGDLQHVYIERKDKNQIVMTVFYTASGGIPGSKCSLDLTQSEDLDGPLELVGLHGAMPFHLDHTISRSLKNATKFTGN